MESLHLTTEKTKPFLRWVGGKRWFLPYLDDINPKLFSNYHEPFLGGGAVFFNFNFPRVSYLSDLNPELMNAYDSIKNDVENVIDELSTYKNTEKFYYKIRGTKFISPYKKAARFIFLNKTSFNGIYRVNNNGEYNVPFGFIKKVDFIDETNLRAVSLKLQKANLNQADFTSSLKKIKKDDLVFLDPPYTVAHENNGFIEYNQKIFSLEDQKRLAKMTQEIRDKKAFFILTNAKHVKIKEMYEIVGDPIPVSRMSTIGGYGAERKMIREYLFTNIQSIKDNSLLGN